MSVGGWILLDMKTSSLDRLRADLGALAKVWAGAMPAFGPDAAVDEFETMSGPGLVRVVDAAARMRRSLDAVLARAADEVAKRSAPEFGAEGLAKQQGFSSPARLVAAATGGAPAEASRLLEVGAATRERSSFSGEVVPAKFASVRRALDEGRVSVEAAAAITGMLRRVEVRADPGLLEPCQQRLVEFAEGQPLSLVLRAVKAAEARLDPDGVGPADERLYAEQGLTFHEDGHGMFRLRGRLDPVTAAPIKAALDALISDALNRRGTGTAAVPDAAGAAASDGITAATDVMGAPGAGGAVVGPVVADERSIPQIRADALAELARHALGCTAGPGTAPKTTIVVRMSLDALRDGTGLAEIDGIDRRIAAATARKLAADAELIPIVLGSDSAPLDLGRTTRPRFDPTTPPLPTDATPTDFAGADEAAA